MTRSSAGSSSSSSSSTAAKAALAGAVVLAGYVAVAGAEKPSFQVRPAEGPAEVPRCSVLANHVQKTLTFAAFRVWPCPLPISRPT